MSSTSLQDLPVSTLKGVGPKVAEHLSRLDIHNVQDLLFHLPLRYEDRTRVTPIFECRPGDRVLIEGAVFRANITGGRKANLSVVLQDDSGSITLRFFHFTATQKNRLSADNVTLQCFGEVRQGYRGGLEMMHPEYTMVTPDSVTALSDRLTPIYPTTKGLHQMTLRKLTEQALYYLNNTDESIELLPPDMLQQMNLSSLRDAIQLVHRPPADVVVDDLLEGRHPAQQRLAFEELTAHQLSLQQSRHSIRQHNAPVLQASGDLGRSLQNQLPFNLTKAQQRVIQEIADDLSQPQPMLRLVQGDVGSGKTIVAAIAILQAVECGYQAAIMAPTEILAEQHLKSFKQWLEVLGINIGWLSGSLSGKPRAEALERIANGDDQVIVGTHALFQNEVQFKNLALLIIDEQHRFGVHQRLALKEKGMKEGVHPHQLIMTATPIPRTLAMSAYADLDSSVIDELPPGRKPINTVLISSERRQDIVSRVQVNCEQQRQAYWVCTLIDESEVLQCQAAEATYNELQQCLPNIKVGLVHGRMKSSEKETVMSAFKKGDIDLLIATTVIEVGVDVPNASLMIIENCERLGLAQLHQLRGRVGRGEIESHCVLLYQAPLSKTAEERLIAMRNSNDGFEIARVDLEMRGPGEVLGVRQAGLMQMRVADLIRDKDLLPQVQQVGKVLVHTYPDLVNPIIHRWIMHADKYVQV